MSAAVTGVKMNDIVKMNKSLNAEWNRKTADLSKCGDLLDQLKVMLLSLNFLPATEGKPSGQELILARDVLEIGALWSIKKKEIPSFQRYMAQLKSYYLDYNGIIPESSYMYQLLGLNLLCLLSQNRLAEFHTELELLPASELLSNMYIKHPVSMEQYLMEGSYNKVFLAKGNVPAESYNFFIDILLGTIRDEIASCAERAYDRISFSEAARILFFDSQKSVKEYGEKRQWHLSPDRYFYFSKTDTRIEESLPSMQTVAQNMEYARELEMIV